MKATLLSLALSVLALVANAKDPNKEPARKPQNPFKSIVVRGDTIVATVSGNDRNWARADSFAIRSGETLKLGPDRTGWRYEFKPRFQPLPVGLAVACTYDTTGVGIGERWQNPRGGIKRTEILFLPAK